MKTDSQEIKSHLFICTHSRDDRASCAAQGSMDLVTDLKAWVKSENLKGQVKVTKSGCLGRCEEGIVAVCYPQKKWYTEISKGDLEILKKELK